MITRAFAEAFAAEWIAAWNSHDLERILSHYTEDFVFSSPFIPVVAGEPSGVLRGKAAIRDYWSRALAKRKDLRFELLTLLVGINSVVLYYRRQDGALSAEHFEFDAHGKVARSSAHYTG